MWFLIRSTLRRKRSNSLYSSLLSSHFLWVSNFPIIYTCYRVADLKHWEGGVIFKSTFWQTPFNLVFLRNCEKGRWNYNRQEVVLGTLDQAEQTAGWFRSWLCLKKILLITDLLASSVQLRETTASSNEYYWEINSFMSHKIAHNKLGFVFVFFFFFTW